MKLLSKVSRYFKFISLFIFHITLFAVIDFLFYRITTCNHQVNKMHFSITLSRVNNCCWFFVLFCFVFFIQGWVFIIGPKLIKLPRSLEPNLIVFCALVKILLQYVRIYIYNYK